MNFHSSNQKIIVTKEQNWTANKKSIWTIVEMNQNQTDKAEDWQSWPKHVWFVIDQYKSDELKFHESLKLQEELRKEYPLHSLSLYHFDFQEFSSFSIDDRK